MGTGQRNRYAATPARTSTTIPATLFIGAPWSGPRRSSQDGSDELGVGVPPGDPIRIFCNAETGLLIAQEEEERERASVEREVGRPAELLARRQAVDRDLSALDPRKPVEVTLADFVFAEQLRDLLALDVAFPDPDEADELRLRRLAAVDGLDELETAARQEHRLRQVDVSAGEVSVGSGRFVDGGSPACLAKGLQLNAARKV